MKVGGAFSVAGNGVVTQTSVVNAATQTITPVLSQTLDRWGQAVSSTDANGNTTTTQYDQAGRMIEVKLPQTDVARADGSIVRANPKTRSYYNAIGNLIAVVDANSNNPADPAATAARFPVNPRSMGARLGSRAGTR